MGENTAEEFLIATCGKGYVKPNYVAARRRLEAAPELSRASVYCAAAAGDYPALLEFIQHSPGASLIPGSFKNAAPLIYAASSILGKLECVALLLKHGGDPNCSWTSPEFP